MFVKAGNVIDLLVTDIADLLKRRLLYYLEFNSKKNLVSHLTELIQSIDIDISKIENIVLYPTHIEVYINKPNIYKQTFEITLGITINKPYSPSIVILSNNTSISNNTSTRIHELQHVKQQLIKEMLNPTKNRPNTDINQTDYLSYSQLFDEITAFTMQILEECKDQATYNCFQEKILKPELILTILNYDEYIIKNIPKSPEIVLKTKEFFRNLVNLILLTQDEKNFQEIISMVLNNLNIKYTNYNTFEILPLRILQSIDALVGKIEIKAFRKSKSINQVELIVFKVESLKKELEKESQKEYPLLPKYLNLIKLEIEEQQKVLEDLMKKFSTDHDKAELKEQKEKLIQALRDIQEIEILY